MEDVVIAGLIGGLIYWIAYTFFTARDQSVVPAGDPYIDTAGVVEEATRIAREAAGE